MDNEQECNGQNEKKISEMSLKPSSKKCLRFDNIDEENPNNQEHFDEDRDQLNELPFNKEIQKDLKMNSINENDSNSSTDNNDANVVQQVTYTESSKMIMMVIIENNGANFKNTNLKPILESGLKKLEQAVNNEVIKDEVNIKSQRSSNSEMVISSVKKVSRMRVSATRCITPVKTPSKKKDKLRTPRKTPRKTPKKGSQKLGLVSSVTQFLTDAFKIIPDKMTRSWRNSSQLALKNPAIFNADGILSSNIDQEPLAHQEFHTNDTELDTACSLLNKNVDLKNIDKDLIPLTPCSNRYRKGWVKIKARPPIARMRRLKSELQKDEATDERF